MSRTRRRPVIRSAVACAALTAGLLTAAPQAASAATCQSRSQPGITVSVGSQSVRIPAVYVEVCVEANVDPVPIPNVRTSGWPCESGCLAIMLDWGGSQPNSGVTVTYSIDGSGDTINGTVPFTGGWGGEFCYFGVGFPSPPAGGCFVNIDPDG
ncbi:MAG: hypothetical protein M3273_01875 [Actinomycetota bacterium]|nr:hypothetical protein [Actinomycetota bacterium]